MPWVENKTYRLVPDGGLRQGTAVLLTINPVKFLVDAMMDDLSRIAGKISLLFIAVRVVTPRSAV